MNQVVFFLGAVPPQTGGEFYNYNLYKYLCNEGFDVACISLHKKLIVRLSLIPLIGYLLTSIVLALRFYRYQGIFVEDHYFSQYLLLHNLVQRVFRGQKIIILVHSLEGYDTSDKFFLRRWINGFKHKLVLSVADIIVTNSEYSKDEIVSLGISHASIQILLPGIDRKTLQIVPQNQSKEGHQILCVANYLPIKGLTYLIEAFSLLNHKDFTLHLVGNPKKSSPAYYSQMQNLVRKLNVNKDVFFHDGSDQENVYRLYSDADIFVLPTLKETFGIVLIEAMHYGLPIITTNVAAVPELIADNENGLLVPPVNSLALAAAISKLIDNPELRKKMGSMGKQRVANSYYWEQTYSQFLSLVKSMN